MIYSNSNENKIIIIIIIITKEWDVGNAAVCNGSVGHRTD
jgi:hypothetical protein